MKHFLHASLLGAALIAGSAVSYADSASRVYGVQISSDTDYTGQQKLVSFPVDDPATLTVEQDLSEYSILAATAHDGVYYMYDTADGILPSRFITYDMAHHSFNEVKVLDYNYDEAANYIILDMTYDATGECIYAVGADIREGQIIDQQLVADFGLIRIDPATGDAEWVGPHEFATLVSIVSAGDDLFGLDEGGNLWLVDKYTGGLYDIITFTDIFPAGLQSIAYDSEAGTFYWGAFSMVNEYEAKSELIAIHLSEEWDVTMTNAGAIGGNSQLIGLYVDPNPLDPAAPRAVEDLVVVPADGGKGEATLSWINPELTMGGDKLDGTLTLTVKRDEETVATLTGDPAQKMTWTDTEVPGALFTYSVTASAGELTGATTYALPVFVGTDIPGAPLDVEARRTGEGYAISVEWKAPEKGAQGGWYDASDLHYRVVRYPDNKVMAESTAALSLIDEDITRQCGYSYGVMAIAGEEAGPEAVSNIIVSGAPIEPPYNMDLSESDASLWTVANADGDDYQWYVHRTGWGGTWDPMFRYYPENIVNPYDPADDWIISPSFALKAGAKYVVTYDLRLLGDLFPANTSLWIGDKAEPEAMTTRLALFDWETNDIEWETHTVPVSVDADGAYNIGFRVENLVPVQLMNFVLREVEDIDLEAVSIKGPSSMAQGEEAAFKVSVRNAGFAPVETFTVALVDAEGNELASQSYDKLIAAGAVEEVEISWTPEAEGRYSVAAEVSATGDEAVANNRSLPVSVTVIGNGTWFDITNGKSISGFVPFNASKKYSASQSIYTADLLDGCEGKQIKVLEYYINTIRKDTDAALQIWLGTTDRADFSSAEPVAEADLTKVFDGTVSIAAGDKRLSVLLDTPFEYNGGNLVVFFKSEVSVTGMLAFDAAYVRTDPDHSLMEAGDEAPFDFDREMTPVQDIPNVSLLLSGASGMEMVSLGSLSAVSYDRASRLLTVGGEYESCDVYTVSGVKIASVGQSGYAVLPASVSGVGIVEVVTSAGRSVTKIIF